jgi:hypothetical protein
MPGKEPQDRPEQASAERRERHVSQQDVLAAMAVYSADGQVDDETGGDALAGAQYGDELPEPEEGDDREPRGPN